ncbi:hypothetical protein D3C87_1747550 [compost metagenome]
MDAPNPRRYRRGFAPHLELTELVSSCLQIFESAIFADKGQPAEPGGAFTLLANDDLGSALVLRVGVIHLIAVYEHDHIRVLFDGTRLA